MPEETVKQKAEEDKREGKSPSTQAGEFVREEIHHVREGKHGARSPQQAIAIGLSKARRAGVKLPPPGPGKAKPKTRRSAQRAYAKGQSHAKRKVSPRRSAATKRALKREGRKAASREGLARQAHAAAGRRSRTERSAAAQKAARTKGHAGRQAAARKAARTKGPTGRQAAARKAARTRRSK